jgi:DNA-binding NarL/FixJ family response regulator
MKLMGLNVLIAESHDVLRIGLRAIFANDPRVSNIYEATNEKELRVQLNHNKLSFIVLDQCLVRDIALLKSKHFVLLASELDVSMLKAAYKYGARGYLSTNVLAELLRATLCPTENTFLIEPTFIPRLMELICKSRYSSVKEDLLTPREKEIFALLCQGLARPAIARRLGITQTTLVTHIRNISKKRDL